MTGAKINSKLGEGAPWIVLYLTPAEAAALIRQDAETQLVLRRFLEQTIAAPARQVKRKGDQRSGGPAA